MSAVSTEIVKIHALDHIQQFHVSTWELGSTYVLRIYNGANRSSKAVLHVLNKFGAGQKCGAHICRYLSSGRGRKSGGARATGATPSLAPLFIQIWW